MQAHRMCTAVLCVAGCVGAEPVGPDGDEGGGTGSAGFADDSGWVDDTGAPPERPCARAEIARSWTRPAEGALAVVGAGGTTWVVEGTFGVAGLALQAHAPDGAALGQRVEVDPGFEVGAVDAIGLPDGRVVLLLSDADQVDHRLLRVGPDGVEATAEVDGIGLPALARTAEGWVVAEAGLRGGRVVAFDEALQQTAALDFGADTEVVVADVGVAGSRVAVAWRDAAPFTWSPPRIEVVDLAAGTRETRELPSESSYGGVALGAGPDDHVHALESLTYAGIRSFSVDLDDPSPAPGEMWAEGGSSALWPALGAALGGELALWVFREDGESPRISLMGRTLDGAGAPLGEAAALASAEGCDTWYPAVVGDGLVTWQHWCEDAPVEWQLHIGELACAEAAP